MLPETLAPLFALDVLHMISKPQQYKIKWLFTIWSSRDTLYGPHRRRQGVYDLYKKWKGKIGPKEQANYPQDNINTDTQNYRRIRRTDQAEIDHGSEPKYI